MSTSEQRRAQQDVHLEKLAQAEQILKLIPGVLGVGIGFREKSGIFEDEICFIVYVEEKKSASQFPANETIPKEILGLKTDVQAIETVSLTVEERKFRPLIGGIKIVSSAGVVYSSGGTTIHGGTLGCVARLVSDNTPVLLTNHHVLYPTNSAAVPNAAGNDKVGQPSAPATCCCCLGTQVATIIAGQRDGTIDAAIARIQGYNAGETDFVNYTNEILSIGWIAGTNATVTVGDVVRKFGKSSELTTGTINAISAATSVTDPGAPGGSRIMSGQIRVTSPAGQTFSIAGDSGSVLVNANNEIIGLNHASNSAVGPLHVTMATPIATVMTTLGIAIDRTGTADTIPLSANVEGNPVLDETDLAPFLHSGETESAPPFLNKFLDSVENHLSEIMNLINNNREVKVVWNKNKGPAFTGHLQKGMKEKNHKIPFEIEGVSRVQLALSISFALEKNGSPALKSWIDKYAEDLILLLANGETIEEISQNAE